MDRRCPTCVQPMNRILVERSVSGWKCTRCGGLQLDMKALRSLLDATVVRRLWKKARGLPADGPKCPTCARAMADVRVVADGLTVTLDVCHGDRSVWFDRDEFERSREHEVGTGFGREAPDRPWKFVPALLGFPVEARPPALAARPVLTWGLAAALVYVHIATLADRSGAIERFALVPAEWTVTAVLTSFFLHAGVLHLVSNTWMLLVFGDNVEDVLGKLRFLGLLLVATAAGDLLHVALDPRVDVPMVGASGGLSGLITFYALRFPRSRIGFLSFWILWWHAPAWFMFAIWVALQGWIATAQVAGGSNVSALAHLGGGAVGALAWWIWRRRG